MITTIKTFLGLIIDYFKKDASIDAIFGDIGIVDGNNRIIRINRYLRFDYASGVFNGFGKIISSNAIFWRKQLTDQVGLLDENYDISMDSEYWSRLFFKRKDQKK